MAEFITRRRRTAQPSGQPQVDYDNPLTKDIAFAVIPVGAGISDVVGGRIATPVGSTPIYNETKNGLGFQPNAATSLWYERDTGLEPTGSVTWAVVVTHVASYGTSFQRPMGKTYNNGGSTPFLSYDFESSGVGTDLMTANCRGSANKSTATATVPKDVRSLILGRFDAAAQTLRLYINGVGGTAVATGFSALSYDTTSTGRLIVGGASSAGVVSAPTNDTIHAAFVWGRALSDAEIVDLYNNPWQMFRPQAQRIWLGPPTTSDVTVALTGVAGTGAAGTLTPSTTVPTTGVAGTGAAGTVTPSTTVATTGVAATGAVGSVTPSTSVAATGVIGTGAAGTVTPSTTVGLTGVVGTGAVGNVSVGGDITVAITGVTATGAVGTLGVSHTQSITGVAATSSIGSVVPSLTLGITGVEGTGLVGTVTGSGGTSAATTPVGGGKGRRRRQVITYLIEIDGEQIEVATQEQALKLLKAAKYKAIEEAQKKAQKALIRLARNKPVALEVPKIALVRPPDFKPDLTLQRLQAQIEAAQAEVERTYRQNWQAVADEIHRRAMQDEADVEAIITQLEDDERKQVGEIIKLLGKTLKGK